MWEIKHLKNTQHLFLMRGTDYFVYNRNELEFSQKEQVNKLMLLEYMKDKQKRLY